MEDFRIDIVLGEGMNARTISMQLKRFTLIGATTRSGMLSGPMRDRFKMHEHLEFYTVEELAQIVRVNAAQAATRRSPTTRRWNWPAAAAARRASPTPGCAGRGSYAASEADGTITLDDRPGRAGHGRGGPRRARQAGPPLPGDADRRLRRRPDRRRGAGRDDEPRRPTRSPTRSSRTCCASSSSSARRAAASRRRGRTALLGRKPKVDDKQSRIVRVSSTAPTPCAAIRSARVLRFFRRRPLDCRPLVHRPSFARARPRPPRSSATR